MTLHVLNYVSNLINFTLMLTIAYFYLLGPMYVFFLLKINVQIITLVHNILRIHFTNMVFGKPCMF